jgi:AcrR family transcriptional regulator
VSTRRKRLSPEESRSAAIKAARRLLIADGPQAVTLKAVAAEVGRTHANLLHHFGSAAGLQGELARAIADSVRSSITNAVERARAGEADARDIIDQTFDVFDREGAGALAAWMILTGNRDALNPILDSLRALVAQLSVGHEEQHVAESTLALVLSALGDSLLGGPIAEALGLPRDTARELAAERLRHRLAQDHPDG